MCVVSDGCSFWVGEIVRLLEIVYKESDSTTHGGDVVVHEYCGDDKGPHYPMYTRNSTTVTVEKGNQVPDSYKPILTTVWAECCICWDTEKKF